MSANARTARLGRSHPPQTTAFAGLVLAILLGFLAIGAVLPILPSYVHGPLASGDVAVGVVMGSFAFSAVVSRPIAGRMADAAGRRRVVLFGLVLIGAGSALQLIHLGVPGLIAARLVIGWGEGWAFTAGATWSVDLAPPHRRAQAIGLFGVAVWGGLSLGPVIGTGLCSLGSYELVFAFAGACPLVGAWVTRALHDPHEARGAAEAAAARGPLVPPEVRLPGFALALANAGYATMVGFLVLHLDDRGIGHGAAAFTAFATAVVLGRLALGWMPDRFGARRAAVWSFALEATGLAIVALAETWLVAGLGSVVMGLGFSMLFPSLASVVVERTSDAQRGRTMGVLTAFFDVGMGLGAPLAGAIAAAADYGEAFWAGAAMAVLGGLLARGGRGEREPQLEAPPAPAPV